MKFELLSLIFEESTYLVKSGRVVFIHIKHQEDDDGESGGFIVVVMGKCIKCELAGVRNIFLTPALSRCSITTTINKSARIRRNQLLF